MNKYTWEELAESQDFEHGQEFITLEEMIEIVALSKGQFDIVKMQRDRFLEALNKVIEYDSSFVDQTKGKTEMRMVALKALKENTIK